MGRNFLLLEMLIALFLIGSYALPLAHFPMRAIQEEIKSYYRIEMHRFADLAFSEFKEKLYLQEIPWEAIAHPVNDKAKIFDDIVELSLDPVGTHKFKRVATVHSVGKKDKEGIEWRLATFRVKFTPSENRFKPFRTKSNSRSFTYQVLLKKTTELQLDISAPEAIPALIETG